MEETTSGTPLEDLLHNAEKAQELLEILETRARQLEADDVREILEKLEKAETQGSEVLTDVSTLNENDLAKAKLSIELIRRARKEAEQSYKRKHDWETKVRSNADIIYKAGSRAAELHRMLREHRRQLRARDVDQMRQELIALESEAMAAWGVAQQQIKASGRFERRLARAVQSITGALRDARGTLARKKPWEDAVAANVAAVRAELERLDAGVESLAGGEGDTVEETREPATQGASGDVTPEKVPTPASEAAAPPSAMVPEAAEVPAGGEPLPPNIEVQEAPAPASVQRPPEEDRESRTSGLISLVKRIEEMIRNRRPIDRDQREVLTARLTELAHKADIARHLRGSRAGRTGARGDSNEVLEARQKVDAALGQAEAALGIQANAGPRESNEEGPEARGVDSKTDDLATSREEASDERAEPPSDEQAPPPLELGAIKMIQGHLRRAREVLESPMLSGHDRRLLWPRLRKVSSVLRARRTEVHAAEMQRIEEQVAVARDLAAEGSPSRARQHIQDLQKVIISSVLNRSERDVFLQALREAWSTASSHQQELRETHIRREAEGINRLAGHLERWERRRDGITRSLERLDLQRKDFEERQKTSTSIGFRVVAAKRMFEITDRISELRKVLKGLDAKIEDVRPRLESAGWTPGCQFPVPGEKANTDERSGPGQDGDAEGDRRDDESNGASSEVTSSEGTL